MKIACIIKQVPDAEARIKAAGGAVDLEGVTFVIDGMDEYGVEQALRLREGGLDAEIFVLALGPKRFEEAIRTALAMGADRAIHLEGDMALDPISQAKILAQVIQKEGAELVFVGGKEADWDSAALGAALAEALGWAFSDWTTEMGVEGSSLTLTHDTDDGSETLSFNLPAVISTQQGLNEPRYPTLPNIMKAKRKPVDKVNLSELASAGKTQVLKQEIQSKERRHTILTGDAQEAASKLVQLLRQEAKVI
ncbi:MAG: electron transfer flavoprotein subunit beta/FixA family protein [Deinococcales bacterium]